jgi:hypothetical protein
VGIFKAIFGSSGNATSGRDRSGADAFGKGQRVKGRHAETWARNRSGSTKSLWKQSQEHKRNGGRS